MRLIDAIPLKQSIAISSILKDGKTLERIIDEQPTIELRCEECEAFNKTRLLIPQPERKNGVWVDFSMSIKGVPTEACGECGEWSYGMGKNYCPNCGSYNGGEYQE